MDQKIVVRCRGIILDENEMLVVTHPGQNFFALPGGKLEWGEDPLGCIERELIEELGIKPKIGRLFYVNTFVAEERHTTEFLFEILNGADYRNWESMNRTHSHELAGLKWVNKNEATELLPAKVALDFKDDNLLSDVLRFIKD